MRVARASKRGPLAPNCSERQFPGLIQIALVGVKVPLTAQAQYTFGEEFYCAAPSLTALLVAHKEQNENKWMKKYIYKNGMVSESVCGIVTTSP